MNKLNPYCKQTNRQNFDVWNNPHQRAAGLFQTVPYDRPLVNSSLASRLSWRR